MTLTKWKPFNGLTRFFDEDFPVVTLPKFGWDLAVDLYEKEGKVIAEMNLPGIDAENIDITIEDNYLKISGTREEKKEIDEKDYYSKEIRRGSFERTVELPTVVRSDKAEAEYKEGVLRVILPKDETRRDDKIKIKVKK